MIYWLTLKPTFTNLGLLPIKPTLNKLLSLNISLKFLIIPLTWPKPDLMLIMLLLILLMPILLIKKTSETQLPVIEILHKLILMKKLLDGRLLKLLIKLIWLNSRQNQVQLTKLLNYSQPLTFLEICLPQWMPFDQDENDKSLNNCFYIHNTYILVKFKIIFFNIFNILKK